MIWKVFETRPSVSRTCSKSSKDQFRVAVVARIDRWTAHFPINLAFLITVLCSHGRNPPKSDICHHVSPVSISIWDKNCQAKIINWLAWGPGMLVLSIYDTATWEEKDTSKALLRNVQVMSRWVCPVPPIRSMTLTHKYNK